jgi:hypothetical protein
MKLIELVIDENDEMAGIEAISLVENPAIEEDFLALKKTELVELAAVDEEKRILMGAALIPDKPIYRREGQNEYYIFFTKETVSKASQLYLKKGYQKNATLEHEENIDGVTLVESWIIEDEVHDKSKKYGLSLPVGTWMVSLKIDDDKLWNEYIKAGKVKGFSIEGIFANKTEMSEHDKLKQEIIDILKNVTK